MSDAVRAGRWWGETPLTAGGLRAWRIGPYRLWVRATAREWRLWSFASGDAMEDGVTLAIEADEAELPANAGVTRVGLAVDAPVLVLKPAPADRDVVVRPDIPVVVPSGVRLDLYLTTAVWVIATAGTGGPTLLDQPSHRLSDTWFGPNTLEGELAYAIRTAARLELEEIPHRPHRAITKVTVVNGTRDAFPLEKLKVPVAALALYASPETGLWTDHVTLERRQATDEAEASVGSGPGVPGVRAERVAEPRVTTTPRFSLNAFGRLLGV
ncbi:MAG: hypothetical protein P8Y13_02205 [Deinococcales bacterium]